MKIVLIALMACFIGLLGFLGCKSSKKINIGEVAPEFTLLDDEGNLRSLAEFKGKKVVLYFYPKDNTPGCTKEACSLRDSFDEFKKHNIVVLGVSYDSVKSHKKFKEKQKLPFILLSDKKRNVAHAYGADKHFLGYFYPSRKTFLINEHGVITNIMNDVTPATHADDILNLFLK